MENQTIGQIAGLKPSELPLDTSSLGQWFHALLDKNISDLTICDITRMIQQNILIQIAMPVALKLLVEVPFAGEMYDGHLVKVVLEAARRNENVLIGFDLRAFESAVEEQKEKFCFMSDQSKKESTALCEQLKRRCRP